MTIKNRLKLAIAAAGYAQAAKDIPWVFCAMADHQILTKPKGVAPRLIEIAFFDPRQHPQERATYDLSFDPPSSMRVKPPIFLQNRGATRSLVPMPGIEPFNSTLYIGG